MFLHSYANGRRRNNWIHSIQDVMHDTVNSMAALLRDHFISTLGTGFAPAAYINLSSLHSKTDLNLAPYDSHLPEEDILAAINSFEGDHAPGSDGFPMAFYQKFWSVIKRDIICRFNDIHTGLDNLKYLNDSWITLITEEERGFLRVRLLAYTNGVEKIFSKVLACRLQPIIGNLISFNQALL